MKLSGALAICGVVLIVAQAIWAPSDEIPMPWHFAPLIVGLVALLAGIARGVVVGSGTYRLAVALGIASVVVIGGAITVPLGPFVPTATPPNPTPGEVVFGIGLSLGVLSALIGAVAIARAGRRRSRETRER